MVNSGCVSCKALILDKNCLGLNKKLLGKSITNFYCLDCLADYLEVTVDELLEKIEEFKEQDCILFR